MNGLAAHRLVFPLIEAACASGTGRLRLRPWNARLAAASAAISGASWSGALVLGARHGLKLGVVSILGAVLISAILVAPRVFVFAPARGRLFQVKSLRDLPAALAFTIALAIADAALAIASRLHDRRGAAAPGRFKPPVAPVHGPNSGRLPADAAWNLSPTDDVPLNGLLAYEPVRADAQLPWLESREWLSLGLDAEPEPGRR